MVRHQHDGRDYWTLPGGGIEPDESAEQTVVREIEEETGLRVEVVRFLFDHPYTGGTSYCYHSRIVGSMHDLELGTDPEEADLPDDARTLRDVRWFRLEDKKDDLQVRRVIECLRDTPGQTT